MEFGRFESKAVQKLASCVDMGTETALNFGDLLPMKKLWTEKKMVFFPFSFFKKVRLTTICGIMKWWNYFSFLHLLVYTSKWNLVPMGNISVYSWTIKKSVWATVLLWTTRQNCFQVCQYLIKYNTTCFSILYFHFRTGTLERYCPTAFGILST